VRRVKTGFVAGVAGASSAFFSSICLPTIRRRAADVPPEGV
jgi:hypothetical protein